MFDNGLVRWPLDDKLPCSLERLAALRIECLAFWRLQVSLRLFGAWPLGSADALGRVAHHRDNLSGRDDTRSAARRPDCRLCLREVGGERCLVEQFALGNDVGLRF